MSSCKQVSVIERNHTITNKDTIIYRELRDRYSVNDTTYIRDSIIVLKIQNYRDSLVMRDTIYKESEKAVTNKLQPFNDLFLLVCAFVLLLILLKFI